MRPHRRRFALKIRPAFVDKSPMPRSRPLGFLRLCASLCLMLAVVALPSVAAAGDDPSKAIASQGDVGSGAPGPRLASPSSADSSVWSDVPATHWAKTAIDRVALDHDWMQDFGATTFKPAEVETRKLLARALVRAFAPTAVADPAVTFGDLPQDDPFWPFAAIAVKKRWMSKVQGNFLPEAGAKTIVVHKALVWALGLRDEALGFEAMHFSDDTPVDTPKNVGAMNIGMLLYLRYNHGSFSGTESQDVGPQTRLSRAEVAFSLYRADQLRTVETWRLGGFSRYLDLDIGTWTETKEAIVEFGLKYVGYPYVYAGEWATPTSTGYCCGAQPVGGFDCTGLVWWLMKGTTSSWDNEPPRPYAGWPLVERSSKDMGSKGSLTWAQKRSGDLLFFDGNNDGTIDHADVFVGMGWALDSSTSIAGVTFLWVGEGSWYRDHFTHARRIVV